MMFELKFTDNTIIFSIKDIQRVNRHDLDNGSDWWVFPDGAHFSVDFFPTPESAFETYIRANEYIGTLTMYDSDGSLLRFIISEREQSE